MAKCTYFHEDENIKPYTAAEAKALIGTKVDVIRRWDADTHRGRAFPRRGWTITAAKGKNIQFDNDRWEHMGDIIDMRPHKEQTNAAP